MYHFAVGGFVLNLQGINMFSYNFFLEYFKPYNLQWNMHFDIFNIQIPDIHDK